MNKIHQLAFFILLFLPGVLQAQKPDRSFCVPELAGTFRLGLTHGPESIWATDSKITVKTEGPLTVYTLRNALTGKGHLNISIRNLKDTEGAVFKIEATRLPEGTRLFWAYGGASGEETATKTNADILPAECKDNVFSIEGNAFTVYYGSSRALKTFCGITPFTSDIRLSDAHKQETPLAFFQSGKKTDAPALAATCLTENGKPLFFCFYKHNPKADYNYYMLPELFDKGYIERQSDSLWMKSTPD